MDELEHSNRRRLILAGLASIAADFATAEAHAQDPAKVQPESYRVVLETDKLRVLEFRARPGQELCGVGKHSHPAHLSIALTDAKIHVTLPDGKKIVATNKVGDVWWSEAETHMTHNVGGSSVRALVVELKDGTAKKS